ncbi:hypothetical protein DLE01_10415 [Streptomyces sp. FT05W]|nr:hypothetical protein DLE01_10415 [Streptomyces sp. FT05W]
MVFMGDRATLLETGRFVQRSGRMTGNVADAAFVAALAATADLADGAREAAVLAADITGPTGAAGNAGITEALAGVARPFAAV